MDGDTYLMAQPLILALDQGTTSSRAMLFTPQGQVVDMRQEGLAIITPHSGWVEQDCDAIVADTLRCAKALAHGRDIAAIGITNQRETTIIWDRRTGKAIYNAIVWQDRRTADLCEDLKKQALEPMVSEKTGLLLDPYFSATKIAWILDHVDGARALADAGHLAFGTVDSYLIWHMTDGAVHATDVTNASRTALYNIQTLDWDEELLDVFNVPRSLLPNVCESMDNYGQWEGIPIRGIAGDQQAAAIGQACFEPGMMKSTYGTGCFALMIMGQEFKPSQNRLLTTIASRINGVTTYALEGSIFVAGAAVQFLRDNLGFFDDAAQSECIATSVANTQGVVFVPALTGLGAPYWDPHVRGAIFGLSRGTNTAHITRAALEAQAFQTRDLIKAMREDSGLDLSRIRVDGGLVSNDFVCQSIADQTECYVERPINTETTAWGAGALAAWAAGLTDQAQLRQAWHSETVFKPQQDMRDEQAYASWQQAIDCLTHRSMIDH